MDGLRKVPDNVPNKEMLAAHLNKPLTSIPDPFSNEYRALPHTTTHGCAASSTFGFEYEFFSATECLQAGRSTRPCSRCSRSTTR
jgi:lysyl-tRNA synthetase class 1